MSCRPEGDERNRSWANIVGVVLMDLGDRTSQEAKNHKTLRIIRRLIYHKTLETETLETKNAPVMTHAPPGFGNGKASCSRHDRRSAPLMPMYTPAIYSFTSEMNVAMLKGWDAERLGCFDAEGGIQLNSKCIRNIISMNHHF